jgi:ABC-type lipoprotein export system ATPase subunit
MYVEIDSQGVTKAGEVREKVEYLVHHPSKTITDYHSYSGGERQRVRIADMMAFQALLGKFDFMIMDEVLELSLDSSGKDNIINLLRSRVGDISSLFVVSHDSEIKDSFGSVLNIKKKDGVSNVYYS